MKTILIFFLCFLGYFLMAQNTSAFIIVDQFGYLPESQKLAVLKDPQVGFDSNESYSPGNTFALVNALTNEHVYTGGITAWNNGNTDASSGDKVFYFDFSSVNQTGRYYVLDIENELRSYEFEISPAVYNEVLKHAVRSFFYQRAGCAKEAKYAALRLF